MKVIKLTPKPKPKSYVGQQLREIVLKNYMRTGKPTVIRLNSLDSYSFLITPYKPL